MTGRYRLVESIGQGGMGRVWRAADDMLDREVAVKEMRIDGLDAEDARTRRERTLREARATARIDHPNVVRIYDVVDEGERLWIVMELVVGRSLERIVAEGGPLGPLETARIGIGLVTALRQVHARGVLHRDIKPGNVLVEAGARRVVLTDFGIAAIQDAKALTMVGMLVGSPDYMAPERISGRPQGPPSDIWSLGATLCAALGGRSPFSRDTTLATLHAVLYEEPELPPAAGPLREILAALLEKDPEIRPGLDELEASLHPVAFPAPTPTVRVAGGEVRAETEPEPVAEPEPSTPDHAPPRLPWPPGESPTPLYVDPSHVLAPPDPRTPGPDREPDAVHDATPQHRATPPRTQRPATHEPAPQPAGHSSPLHPAGHTSPPHPAGHTSPPHPATQGPPAHPATPGPDPYSASTEAASSAASEVRSETPGAGRAQGTARPGGVSLVPPEAATEERPVRPPPPVMPPGELPGPARPGGPRRPHRRTGLLAAAAAVTAGAVVAVVLLMNSGSPGGNRASDSPTPSTTASVSPQPTVEGTSRPRSLPPGAHREAGGFAWATPEGWRRDVKTGAEVHYTSPDGTQELVAKSSLARGDLMETWQTSEENAHQGQDYRKIRLEETRFREYPAVVWEYTFTLRGTRWHARLLGFNANGKSYQINTWYQPAVEKQALETYERVTDSFTIL
ncbi:MULTISPECIES: protein kinase [unclassified Streptomyces]|uniref:serine/threonine-protein kinase n=1 Tax=unclassified Streptomyces TaxID=2593676 RepID=UPI0036EA2B3A